MFDPSTSINRTTAVDALKAGVPSPQGRSFTRRLGALAAAAAIAASLAVALPMQSQATPRADGSGIVVADATAQLPNSGATLVTFIVTKGQKG